MDCYGEPDDGQQKHRDWNMDRDENDDKHSRWKQLDDAIAQ